MEFFLFWSVQGLTRELKFHISKHTNPLEGVSARYELSLHVCVDHASSDEVNICIACGSFVDAEVYRILTHGSAEI